ncbi:MULTISPECIES: MarR family transcriptional regulator [unclassified Streptomyces]|uniref:MarR family winged helix-turn-helix transcriptional regulator n=1 Tax=unclassified Streptomyces TaxID=2593676 RepID=UPI003243BADA
MTATDPAMTALSQSWCALSLLHGRIEAHIERALQAGHELSVREYSLLDVLSRQHDGEGGHLQMKQVADAVVLSHSATTRLVTRLEDRGLLSRYLCPTDRRGIYTDVTAAGALLLEQARPTNDAALRSALDRAAADPELAPLVRAVAAAEPAEGVAATTI